MGEQTASITINESVPPKDAEDSAANRAVFTSIYRDRKWSNGEEGVPLSGPGSNPIAAAPYVTFVKQVIERFGITSVVDCGHGDWMMWRDYKFDDVDYTGFDVAEELSARLQKIHGNENRRFIQADASVADLPPGDLLISKDVLQHLPNQSVLRILQQCGQFKFLLLCNDEGDTRSMAKRILAVLQIRTRLRAVARGKWPLYYTKFPRLVPDISAGQCRGVDLERKPFSSAVAGLDLVHTFRYTSKAEGIPTGTKRVYLFAAPHLGAKWDH